MSSREGQFAPAIDAMLADIAEREKEIGELKRTVNKLCGYAGRSPVFQDTDTRSSSGPSKFRRDQFAGVALATAVRQYLEMRGDSKKGGHGAATVNEIYEALRSGGFAFQGKNDENNKRALRISLTKNTTAFARIPGAGDAAYGLKEWYPHLREPKANGIPEEAEDDTETAAPVAEEPPSEVSSDTSASGQGDDVSEPQEKGGSDGLANHPEITG